jgi:hypothetical protein
VNDAGAAAGSDASYQKLATDLRSYAFLAHKGVAQANSTDLQNASNKVFDDCCAVQQCSKAMQDYVKAHGG